MRCILPRRADRLASLRMLLSVASMCGIRELLKQPTDRADEAEMIQPLTVQPHQAPRPPSSAFRAPPIGCFIPCNSLHERRLQRLARAQLCQDRLRAFGDGEHDRRAGPLAVPTLGLGRNRIPLSHSPSRDGRSSERPMGRGVGVRVRAPRAIALNKGGSPSSGGPTARHLLPEGEGRGAHSDF